jgi:hypothetical protein
MWWMVSLLIGFVLGLLLCVPKSTISLHNFEKTLINHLKSKKEGDQRRPPALIHRNRYISDHSIIAKHKLIFADDRPTLFTPKQVKP